MKKSELFKKHESEIIESIRKADREIYECNGNVTESIYIWSDGQIETLMGVPGGSGYLNYPKDDDEKTLHFVCRREHQGFDVFDSVCQGSLADGFREYDEGEFNRLEEAFEESDETDLIEYIRVHDELLYDRAVADGIDYVIDETDYDEIFDEIIRDCEFEEKYC